MNTRFYILPFTFAILLLAGCTPTRHLKGKEKLLYDLDLHGVQQSDAEKIEVYYRQKPNRKVPIIGWMPYLSVYYLGKALYNPGKIQFAVCDEKGPRLESAEPLLAGAPE